MAKFLFLTATNGNNLKLAQMLSEIAEDIGAETDIVQLGNLNLPLYTPESDKAGPPPKAAVELVNELQEADAFILLAPEYNGSIPPVVVNAVAWMSRATDDWRAAFNGKFAVVGTHSGGGGHKVVEAMRSQLNHLGTIVLARTFTTNFKKPQNPDSARAIFSQLLDLVE